ncbi:nicotinate-nucleotide--dimethylbenzimidazole phosphoribosyltransferase, partial [Streptomyces sp. NPDC058964]|uniref:nicotinate-nucleotide--dimethylbenzimidazole phosphoribosyltransferase n=1 Tax=Streptomyces sp. NPDC058964 TaxID=3346681 RepID=UPI0036A7AA16
VPPSPILSAPHEQSATPAPRRPLHLGPPIPDASASPVRSLADRGPAGAPVRQSGPPTTGPEYLDVQALRDLAPQSAAPWGAVQTSVAPVAEVGAQDPAAEAETVAPLAEPAAGQAAGQTDAAQTDAAQAAVARLATEAAAVGGTVEPVPAQGLAAAAAPAPAAEPVPGAEREVPQMVHGHDGVQTAHGHDGVYAARTGHATGAAQGPVAGPGAEGVQGPETARPAVGVRPSSPVPASAGTGAPQGVQEAVAVPQPEAAQVPETPQEPQVAPVAQDAEAAPEQVPSAAQGAEAPPEQVAPVAQAQTADAGVPQDAAQPVDVQGVVAEAAGAGPVQQRAKTVAADPAAGPVPAPEPVAAAQAPVAEASAPDVDGVQTATPADGTPVPVVPPTVAAEPAAQAEVPRPGHPGAEETPQAAPATTQPPQAGEAHLVAEPGQEPQAVVAEPHAAVLPADALRSAEAAVPVAAPVVVQPQETAGPAAGAVRPESEAVEPQAQPQPPAPGVEPQAVPAAAAAQPEAPTVAPAAAEAGPQAAGDQSAPGTPEADTPGDPALLQGAVPLQPHPDQPLGQFVPVEGTVPTTPHLAPTPPHPLVLPTQEPPAAAAPDEQVATVPAPREAESAPVPTAPDEEHNPEVAQQAEDLETRAADQEESTAAVAEVRQSTGPAAPGYDDAEREAVLRVMRERRDIRNGFRGDPIPHEVLLRVLEAAHTAPSVGHSQPWDFVVIRSAETRRTMHELAMRQRDAYAKSLPKGRAKQFKELKIEAILDTPVNIVVTADPTRGGRHTLGRHTQPQMAPYSAALAVENLWLAARAEGLGVGWVSFFDEREMVRALGLPEHLEVIAYLCVGYVDEFPDEPELMQAGWSKRRPLSWVVHEETYGRRALPGEDPHDLLAETVAGIRPLDAKALGEAWERQKRMTKPAGALGMLEIISAQLSGLSRQCPPPIPEPAAVAIFAGDHGVHAQGVTPWPQEVTAQMVANFLGGGAVCNAFANQVGAEVCVIDVGVVADLPATPGLLPRKIRPGTSDMTTGPAMTREEAKAAIEVGIETARDLVAAGNKALLTGEMGIANTTASAALISVFTGADPAEVTGRGTGINDETLARKTEVVRRAIEVHQPDPADPIGVLAAIGGFEHAAMVGLLLGGASLRTPVILDGVSAGAAALVARAIAPEVLAACIAGHRSAEPGHVAALNKLGLRPLVDLDLRLGEGTGALLALPLVQSTARAMHEVATFDSAGVTEK